MLWGACYFLRNPRCRREIIISACSSASTPQPPGTSAATLCFALNSVRSLRWRSTSSAYGTPADMSANALACWLLMNTPRSISNLQATDISERVPDSFAGSVPSRHIHRHDATGDQNSYFAILPHETLPDRPSKMQWFGSSRVRQGRKRSCERDQALRPLTSTTNDWRHDNSEPPP